MDLGPPLPGRAPAPQGPRYTQPRKGPQKVAAPPEQIAAVVTAKLMNPVGRPDKAEITLRLVRAARERLAARAHREVYLESG